MRHRIADKKFNRNKNQRKNLFRVLLRALTEQGQIVTTEKKAKVLKRLADKLVGRAQDNSQASRRNLHKSFGKRDAVNTLVDKVAPAMKDRQSGFVRITPLGNRRGDNTPMAKVEFVKMAEVKGLHNANAVKTEAQPAKKAVSKPAVKAAASAEASKTKDQEAKKTEKAEKKPSVKKVKKAEAK
jgi:large subunit ribosomal protein L17